MARYAPGKRATSVAAQEGGATTTLLISGRWATSCLVRWCPDAETWQPEDEQECAWQHGTDPPHRLRLRRMVICSDCSQGYFTRRDFSKHICYSAA